MFTFFQSKPDREPARSGRGPATRIGRLLAAKDFKALCDFADRDWNTFALELNQYSDFLELLTPQLLSFWAREYTFTDRLGELHTAFAEFSQSGSFVYRERRVEVREISAQRAVERAKVAVDEGRKDAELRLRICLFFLMLRQSSNNVDVERLNELALEAHDLEEGVLQAKLLALRGVIDLLEEEYSHMGEPYLIARSYLEGKPVRSQFAGRTAIEAILSRQGVTIRDALVNYGAYLKRER